MTDLAKKTWPEARRLFHERTVAILPVDSTALCVVFGPDGKRLVTGSAGGRVSVWESELASARELWRGLAARGE